MNSVIGFIKFLMKTILRNGSRKTVSGSVPELWLDFDYKWVEMDALSIFDKPIVVPKKPYRVRINPTCTAEPSQLSFHFSTDFEASDAS